MTYEVSRKQLVKQFSGMVTATPTLEPVQPRQVLSPSCWLVKSDEDPPGGQIAAEEWIYCAS
jgi:hypothetical protein